MLAYHRESVRSLVGLGGSLSVAGCQAVPFLHDSGPGDRFASGSLDGSILVWQAGQDILPSFRLNFPEQYINSDHIYMYSVNFLLKVGEVRFPRNFERVSALNNLSQIYLAACIGNCFKVYDTRTGDCVMDCQNAHNANVLSIASLYFDTALVTSSADTSIRIWSARQGLNLSVPVGTTSGTLTSNCSFFFSYRFGLATPHLHATGVLSSPQKVVKDQGKNAGAAKMHLSRSSPDVPKDVAPRPGSSANQRRFMYIPMLVGELWAHSDQVNMLLPLSPFSFASASHDSTVIIWNDGRVESDKRSEIALNSLGQFKAQCEWNDQLLAATAAAAVASHDFGFDEPEDLGGGELPNSPFRARSRPRSQTAGAAGRPSESDDFGPDVMPKFLPEPGFRVFGSHPSGVRADAVASPGASSGGEESTSPLTSPEPSNAPSRNRSAENLSSLVSSPSSGTLRLGMSPSGAQKTVRVPDYIFDNAVFMLREQDLSIEQIREELRNGGNSESIVEATIQKLQNL